MTKTHNLFPTTFFQTEVDSNNFLKETLCEKILEASKYMKAPETWFTNKLKTSFVGEPPGFNIIEDNFPLLKKTYLKTIGKIIKRPHEIDLVHEDAWYNVYQDGEYQDQHDHLGSYTLTHHHYSCIHFLSFDPKQHEPPVFSNPVGSIAKITPQIDESSQSNDWEPEVKEGDLLMFPIYIPHAVHPCKKSDYPRITITFNFTLTYYNSEEIGEFDDY